MSQLRAVATGDVVASSELSISERRRLPNQLQDVYRTVQEQDPEVLPHSLAVVRGDGWQCYIDAPSRALDRVLQFWSLLCVLGIRSRFVLAVDTVDFVTERGPNESDGAAFRRSGRGLNNLASKRWMACKLPEDASVACSLAADGIAELMDHLMHEWTEAQAQAVAGMLRGVGTETSVTQRSIGEQWNPEPITRQSVNRHLHRASWPRVKRALSRFERLVDEIPEVAKL
jgi:hypothetical protein